MNFLTFLLYYLVIDVIISLSVFGILYYFRRDILLNIRLRLNQFIDNRIQFNKDVDIYLEEDEEDLELKPEMQAALDKEFNLNG